MKKVEEKTMIKSLKLVFEPPELYKGGNMLKKIPIDVTTYKDLKEGNYYFVDKTLMIKKFLDKGRMVTLVTRPRKFGKTINMSMLAEFFDITKDSHKLFEGTKIMNTPYASEMNQYPVIYLSFASAKREKENVIITVKELIKSEWDRYSYVFEGLMGFKKSRYERLYRVLNDYSSDLTGIEGSIAFLMERLHEYYSKEVMVFIDEYDTPFMDAYMNGFYDDVCCLAWLLERALKVSNDLKYGFVTGVQRGPKEKVFSDLENIDVFKTTDKEYAEYFGFTIEETKEFLKYYSLEFTDEVKDLCDVYKIENREIYNLCAISNYAFQKLQKF